MLIILVCMSCCNGARGACLDWSQHVGSPEHRVIFVGTVDNRPVRMMLHLDQKTDRFDGAFGYNDQAQMSILSGRMQPDKAGANFDARDSEGRVIGEFILKFHPLNEAHRHDQPQNYGCDSLSGTWLKSAGSHPVLVALHDDGEIIPEDDKARAINEITAYRLRDAMLHNDREAFMRLLSFPFVSETQMQVPSTWGTPQAVIRNYDRIVTFSNKEIERAVPHVLETAAGRSLFMNNSIEIEAGKVTRICEATCSVAP